MSIFKDIPYQDEDTDRIDELVRHINQMGLETREIKAQTDTNSSLNVIGNNGILINDSRWLDNSVSIAWDGTLSDKLDTIDELEDRVKKLEHTIKLLTHYIYSSQNK